MKIKSMNQTYQTGRGRRTIIAMMFDDHGRACKVVSTGKAVVCLSVRDKNMIPLAQHTLKAAGLVKF